MTCVCVVASLPCSRGLRRVARSGPEPGADGQVSPALDEQSCDPQPFVATLCDGVEDGRLPANTLLVYRGAGIDVGAPIEEQRCRLEVAVLSCDMEQGPPTQSETAALLRRRFPELDFGTTGEDE